MTLAELIKLKRGCPHCGNGMTIREMAKRIGISPATLFRAEKGKVPDLENGIKICRWAKFDPRNLEF